MEQRATFDGVAKLYGDVRRGYPDALIADAIAFARLAPGDALLEVGCGAGQATQSFTGRGYKIVALDPGARLIDVAREKLADAPDVEFVVSAFESWNAPEDTFKLVFAAQAWHWVPPAVAYQKAAKSLASGGTLAIFGHVPDFRGAWRLSAHPVRSSDDDGGDARSHRRRSPIGARQARRRIRLAFPDALVHGAPARLTWLPGSLIF